MGSGDELGELRLGASRTCDDGEERSRALKSDADVGGEDP